jgi:hypothetical protein
MKTLVLLLLSQSIPTANVDLNRTNANTAETTLTPANLSAGKVGLIGSYSVDGYIFAQPLFVPGITTSGKTHDLVIVATLNNSVYAFDASNPGSAPVWSNLTFASSYANYPVTEAILYSQSIGCMSTPVADTANLKLYIVCDTVVSTTPNWVIRQLDLTTGATLLTTTIAGQVVGTGDPNGGDPTSGPNLLFYPRYNFQRAGLALANNTVYVAFGGVDDARPFHGWLMGYSTSSLAQTGIWCSTPNGFGGAPWMAGGAPAVDSGGNVYIVTGNGTYDGVTAYSESVVQFAPNVTLSNWFVNPNQSNDTTVDADFGANRFLLIPGTSLGVAAGKDFNVYLINTAAMAQVQTFQTNGAGTPSGGSGSYGMTFLNNTLYLPITSGSIYAFAFSGSSFNTTPVLQANGYAFPGPAQMMGSINGTSNGILWAVTVAASTKVTVRPGVLRAINPVTLAEYWNSGTSLGNMIKFAAPSVVGGKIFVATPDLKLQVFGLLSSSVMRGQATLRGQALIQ